MALSLTFGAVSAEDVAADEVVAEEAPALEYAAGGEIVESYDVPTADLEVDVEDIYEDDFGIIWGVGVKNNGPDTAESTVVRVDGSDNLLLFDYYATAGEFFPEEGVWFVGDLKANDIAVLLLDTIKMDKGPYYVEALAVSDTFDPILSNNYDIAWSGLEEVSASAAESTMPAAGNPIAMALLALITIVGASFARRF